MVKSAATVTLAAAGIFFAAPAVGVIALGYDIGLEIVKLGGSSNASDANTVVIGFPQTVTNDAVGLVGSTRQVDAQATKDILQKTLSYPRKSSTFLFAEGVAARLDVLLKTMAGLSAMVTLYQEGMDTYHAFEQVR